MCKHDSAAGGKKSARPRRCKGAAYMELLCTSASCARIACSPLASICPRGDPCSWKRPERRWTTLQGKRRDAVSARGWVEREPRRAVQQLGAATGRLGVRRGRLGSLGCCQEGATSSEQRAASSEQRAASSEQRAASKLSTKAAKQHERLLERATHSRRCRQDAVGSAPALERLKWGRGAEKESSAEGMDQRRGRFL